MIGYHKGDLQLQSFNQEIYNKCDYYSINIYIYNSFLYLRIIKNIYIFIYKF